MPRHRPRVKSSSPFEQVRCGKWSTVLAMVRAHPENYEYDAVAAYFMQDIEKQGPILSINVASVTQTKPSDRRPMNPMALYKEILS